MGAKSDCLLMAKTRVFNPIFLRRIAAAKMLDRAGLE